MNSIRVSLLIYLLLLLVLALGAFSLLTYENASARLTRVYMSTNSLLRTKTERTTQKLEDHFQETKKTIEANFDAKLLLKTQTFSSHLAKQSLSWERYAAGELIAWIDAGVQSPSGFTVLASELNYRTNQARSFSWTRAGRILNPLNLQFVEDEVLRPRAEQVSDLYQVCNDQGEVLLRCKSLSLANEKLPLDPDANKLKLLDPDFDTVQLQSGQRIRQVTILVPVTRMLLHVPAPTGRFGYDQKPRMRTETRLVPMDPKDVEKGKVPRIVVQYARPLTEIEDVLTDMQSDLLRTRQALEKEQEQALGDLDKESRVALASLRTKLGIISALVFLATALGGVWLVGRGLAPLRRVAAAVSAITAQNLQLRLQQQEVPQEAALIVEKLQETLDSLQRTFAREKQALADISHDLRTPIASLLATTQVCLRKQRPPEKYREALESCTEIGQQLSAMVERLLALARLDAGVDTMKPEPVNVPELAEQCIALVRPLAEASSLTLAIERNGPAVARADANKLREVVINLLDNAIHYNKPGGRVDVAVHRMNGHVELAVRDTGIGIAPDRRAQLFERFYRVDPSRQSATMHTGLGLAIVKGYVELMGGSVVVESVEGEGSTFRIQLPAEADA